MADDTNDDQAELLAHLEASLIEVRSGRFLTAKESLADLGMRVESDESLRHDRIAARLLTTLNRAFRGGECAAFDASQLVGIEHGFESPDLSVVCGQGLYRGRLLLNPSAIIEVLSDSSEAYDRGDKFMLYRTRSTLRDYLLVSQRDARIEHWQLRNKFWTLVNGDAESGSIIRLFCGAHFLVDDVYDGVWELAGDDS